MADAVERSSTRLGLHKKKLRSSDIDILRESTLMNLNWPGERFTMQDLLDTAEFARYIVMDARRGDYGVVACTSQGVGWYCKGSLFTSAESWIWFCGSWYR